MDIVSALEMQGGDPLDPHLATTQAPGGGLDILSGVEPANTAEDVANERQLVEDWWIRTSETADFKATVEQVELDTETIIGKPEDVKDPDTVMVNHVYRNAIQTVATVLPNDYGFRYTGTDKTWAMFAKTAQALAEKRLDQVLAPAIIRGWIADSTHYRYGILKVTYRKDFYTDPVSDSRQMDMQENQAEIDRIIRDRESGDIQFHHPDLGKLVLLMNSAGAELEQINRLVIENVPIERFRIDPKVRAPEQFYNADWMRHDVFMTREEILAKWKDVDDNRLCKATRYDETGRKIMRDERDARKTANGQDPGLYLVAEIWDKTTNHHLVMVEGLDTFVAKSPATEQSRYWFPFVLLTMNRAPRRFSGMSDTELQAKIQRRINEKRTREGDAQLAALPRFAYDTAQIDTTDAKRITVSKPWDGIPLNLGGKDIRQAIMPITSNHEFNPIEYDTSKEELELRKMAVLPEQALGATGTANFATEVSVAQAGLNTAIEYRKHLVEEALGILYTQILDLLLLEETPESVERCLGVGVEWPVLYEPAEARGLVQQVMRQAATEVVSATMMGAADPAALESNVKAKYKELATNMFGPMAEPLTREVIYLRIGVKVRASTNAQGNNEVRIRMLAKAMELAQPLGVSLEGTHIFRLIGQLLGEEDILDAAAHPELNSLVTRAIEAMMADPQGIAPETAQLLQAAIPQLLAVLPQPPANPGVDNPNRQDTV